MVEKEKDIVRRLRLGGPNALEIADEAADEIEALQAQLAEMNYDCSQDERLKKQAKEIERLRPLLSEVQDQRTLINSQVAEIARLREAIATFRESPFEISEDVMIRRLNALGWTISRSPGQERGDIAKSSLEHIGIKGKTWEP